MIRLRFDGADFDFKAPGTDVLDHYFSTAPKSITKANRSIVMAAVTEAQKDALRSLLDHKPGVAATIALDLIKARGFNRELDDDEDPNTFDGQAFEFHRPSTDAIDRYFQKAANALTKANRTFTVQMVNPDQKAAWLALITEKPGYAAEVAERWLQDLGFGKTADLGE